VTTPIVPAFAPFADTSLEGLFGVPRFFDRYAYTTTGEAIHGYKAALLWKRLLLWERKEFISTN
jgi:hypothetical protein